MTISIWALKGKLNGKILLLRFFFVGYILLELHMKHNLHYLVNTNQSTQDDTFTRPATVVPDISVADILEQKRTNDPRFNLVFDIDLCVLVHDMRALNGLC